MGESHPRVGKKTEKEKQLTRFERENPEGGVFVESALHEIISLKETELDRVYRRRKASNNNDVGLQVLKKRGKHYVQEKTINSVRGEKATLSSYFSGGKREGERGLSRQEGGSKIPGGKRLNHHRAAVEIALERKQDGLNCGGKSQ